MSTISTTYTNTYTSNQLQQIKQLCMQGRDINNMEIRYMITSLATHVGKIIGGGVGGSGGQNKDQGKSQGQGKEKGKEEEKDEKKQVYTKKEIDEQLDNITKIMLQKNTLLDNKIQTIYTKTTQQLSQFTTTLPQQHTAKLTALETKLTNIIKIVDERSKERLQKYEDIFGKKLEEKMEEVMGEMMGMIGELGKRVGEIQGKIMGGLMEKENENKVKKLKPVEAKEWVDPNCCQYKNLVFEGNKMKVLAWSDIYGLPINKHMPQFSFTLKIERLQNKKMAIGVVDSKLGASIKPSNSENEIYYHSQGYYWNGKSGIKQKIGYAEGDCVTVAVNLKKGTIQWRVNGERRNFLEIQGLANTGICWVPFVFLKDREDTVAIYQ